MPAEKAGKVNAAGQPVHEAAETRPLSVTNADNRIVAAAFRWCWEPLISPLITGAQRGFITGRSMLRNIVDIEDASQRYSLKFGDPATVYFDFSAAFPSLSRSFLMASLQAAGLPSSAIRAVQGLYMCNSCDLVLNGQRFGRISLERGIRQGCPLSPSLFALYSDSLLRIIQTTIPNSVPRASPTTPP